MLAILCPDLSTAGMKPEMNKFVCEIETLFGGRLVVIHKNAAFLFAFDEYSTDGVAFKGTILHFDFFPPYEFTDVYRKFETKIGGGQLIFQPRI